MFLHICINNTCIHMCIHNNILNFHKDYEGVKTFRLEQNYRSTRNIVEAANTIIDKNKTN